MKTRFRESFLRDLSSLREKTIRERLKKLIESVEAAPTPNEIPNIKKLRTAGRYYRIRIGDYRVGIVIEGEVVTFVRCLHRKEIYRYFP